MLEMINQRYMKFLFETGKRPKNISELAKIGDLTLSVASTLISRWAREGVVIKTKLDNQNGKIIITLTNYGKAQVKLLKEINRNHLENKEQMSKEQSDALSLVAPIKRKEGGENE